MCVSLTRWPFQAFGRVPLGLEYGVSDALLLGPLFHASTQGFGTVVPKG